MSVLDRDGNEIARGMIAYSDRDAARIVGKRSADIEALLGFRGRDEIIHQREGPRRVMVGEQLPNPHNGARHMLHRAGRRAGTPMGIAFVLPDRERDCQIHPQARNCACHGQPPQRADPSR